MPSFTVTGIVKRLARPIGAKPNGSNDSGSSNSKGARRVPTAQSLTYAALDVGTAISAYAEERRAQVSKRMAAYWMENARPLTAFFNDTKLRHITPAQLAAYQNARTDDGRAPKTINGELSVLRQILKRTKLWYRFSDEYTTLRNRKPPVGRALTADEQHRLFALAPPSRPSCMPTSPARSRSTAACVRARSKCSAGGHRSDQPSAARTPIEDPCWLAVANPEHDLPRGARRTARSRGPARIRRAGPLRLPVAPATNVSIRRSP